MRSTFALKTRTSGAVGVGGHIAEIVGDVVIHEGVKIGVALRLIEGRKSHPLVAGRDDDRADLNRELSLRVRSRTQRRWRGATQWPPPSRLLGLDVELGSSMWFAWVSWAFARTTGAFDGRAAHVKRFAGSRLPLPSLERADSGDRQPAGAGDDTTDEQDGRGPWGCSHLPVSICVICG